MPVTEGTAALPVDANAVKQMGFLGSDGFLYFPQRGADGALEVDPGQSVMAAAADATGTDKLRWIAASAAAAQTGTAVKGSSGVIYGYHIANLHATDAIYVNFFDAASVTGTPEVTLYVPGGSVLDHPSIGAPIGGWGTGIFVNASSAADGTGNPAAVPLVMVLYK
jgi:hypothetical protein